MKTCLTQYRIGGLLALAAVTLLGLTSVAAAATMLDYCVKPPLIGASIQPNLLLLLDNSQSMYDLEYQDVGAQGNCSASGALCTSDAGCTTGETCNGIVARTATYCYDNTYSSRTVYFGYFDTTDANGSTAYYKYDFASKLFFPTNGFPASCDISVPNTLCLDDNDPPSAATSVSSTRALATFIASGNYLNWLTASKFDVQKRVLTGGKYSSADGVLTAESRGCVGYRFIKEANTADFTPGVAPTSLGITFAVNGPMDPYNATAPSPGGTTQIEVFFGNYNQANCQAAIDAIATNAGNAAIKKAIGDCLTSTGSTAAHCAKDASKACALDSDCNLGGGMCTVVNTGTCNVQNNGICGVSLAGTCGGGATGVCTSYSATATCSGTGGTKVCGNAGPLNGMPCGSKNDCSLTCTAGNPAKIGLVGSCTIASNNSVECALPKTCTAGDPAKLNMTCALDSDCAAKTCTAGLVGNSCTTNAGCNSSSCSAGRVGALCTTNAECNPNSCSAGDPAKIGTFCSANADCDDNKGPCLVPGSSLQTKTGPVFSQSMQACWAYHSGTALGIDDANTVRNQCSGVYTLLNACIGGLRDGRSCTSDLDCTVGGIAAVCGTGADAVRPGNPALLCSRSFGGYCADPGAGIAPKGVWNTTTWNKKEFNTDTECILQKHKEYCVTVETPPVTDPSGSLSQTTNYGNTPAIISGTGVIAQLGDPLGILFTRVSITQEPTGLLQQFQEYVRLGAMSFRNNGSPTECANPLSKIPCPKKCSTSPDPNNPIMCSTRYDCPSPAAATCDAFVDNKDGAQMLYYIGHGHCSLTTTTECATAAHCPAGEVCYSDGAGTHATAGSLIKAIDDLRATSWTPFSEALYDAMGYFAKDPADATNKKSRADLRINPDDYRETLNPSEVKCQRNNVLFITDGMSTADMNQKVLDVLSGNFSPSDLSLNIGVDTCNYAGSKNVDNVADLMRHYNIRTLNAMGATTKPTTPLMRQDYVNVYTVLNSASTGTTANQCDAETLLTATATKGGTVLQKAGNPAELQQALTTAFQQIAADTVSGTAASVLASGEGSGANLVQAVFYPTKEFEQGTIVSWIGRLANMWYYVDPNFTNSSIREDDGDKVLTTKTDGFKQDYITQFYFDRTLQTAMANRWTDVNGDSSAVGETQLTPIKVDTVSSLWEAGTLLWDRLGTTRRVYTTNVTGAATSDNLMPFIAGNASILRPYLNVTFDPGASNIIQWTRGNDSPYTAEWGWASWYRKRKVTMTVGGVQKTNSWKLGDVLNSTPKISSWQPLNAYHTIYGLKYKGDGTPYESTYGPPGTTVYQSDPVNPSYYTTTAMYKGRGMVYAGANDGMLHAFRLGLLEQKWTGQQPNEQGRLTHTVCSNNESILCSSNAQCDTGTCSVIRVLGEEVWAFIPKNMLPYLKYMADPTYCHVYGVDLTPYIFDASIAYPPTCVQDHYSKCLKTASSWRTVLIGGMSTGGACRQPGSACTDCIKTPATEASGKGLGYSSYFALDISDQNNPKLMWEYDGTVKATAADGTVSYTNRLGASTSGPVLVRINANNPWNGAVDQTRNGKWFVVFASGPTGPIDVATAQYLGRSDQSLTLHIFDIADGPGVDNANVIIKDTGIPNSFGGSLARANQDVDRDYTDEAVYFPYVSFATSAQAYRGGVGRLLTRKSLDPNTWDISYLIQNSGPVSAAVASIKNETNKQFWVMFGSGRYFFAKADEADDPNPPKRRQIFGMKEFCLDTATMEFQKPCPAPVYFCDLPASAASCGGLTNVDDVAVTKTIDPLSSGFLGWYIDLDPATRYPLPETIATKSFWSERTITDPSAMSSGVVLFTTFRPYNDPCDMGGMTRLWAVMYNTGGSTVGLIKGKAIMQLSTGSIEAVDLASAFTQAGNRATEGIPGTPPKQPPAGQTSRPALKKVVHIKER